MPGGATAVEAEQAVGDVAQAVGTVFPVAGAIIELADQIVSLFGTTHLAGHDWFIGIPANGGTVFADNETCNQCDTTTIEIGNDMVELINQIFASWVQQGAVLSNPNLVIEIRDDGSPGMLFHPQYVEPLPQAQQVQYNLPGGLQLTNGWNDRDSSQYWSLGPPNQVSNMINALYQVFKTQGWIAVVPAAATMGNPAATTTAVASSGTAATVPALLSSDLTLGGLQIPIWLLIGGGLLFAFSAKGKRI